MNTTQDLCIHEHVVRAVTSHLKLGDIPLAPDVPLDTLMRDSLDIVEIALVLEDSMLQRKAELPCDLLASLNTVGELVSAVEARLPR